MSTASEDTENSESWLEVVRSKVGAIRFGSVQITVHEGRVTQVEAIEKTRIGNDTAKVAQRGARPAGKP